MLPAIFALGLIGCSFDPPARPEFADAGDATTVVPGDVGAESGRDAEAVSDVSMTDVRLSDSGPSLDVAVADSGTDVGVSADSSVVDAQAPDAGTMSGVTVVNGRLTLTTDLKGHVDDCDPAANCEDLDGDELVDEWEQLLLETFRPVVVFDEDETLLTDPDSVVLHVGRVTPVRRRPLAVQMYLTILYDRDYGSCGTLSSHNGDSERVVLTLTETTTGIRVERAYTAAHEGTLADHSERFFGPNLARLEHDETVPGEARWVVYSSKNKHATYATKSICESTSPIPCFAEACGPVYGPGAATARLLDVYNAGEPDAPLLDDLGPIGFPGEMAWAEQSFCGGLNRGPTCPGSVRGKLTEDPF